MKRIAWWGTFLIVFTKFKYCSWHPEKIGYSKEIEKKCWLQKYLKLTNTKANIVSCGGQYGEEFHLKRVITQNNNSAIYNKSLLTLEESVNFCNQYCKCSRMHHLPL